MNTMILLPLWAGLLQSFALEIPESPSGATKYVVIEMYAAGKSTEDFSQPGNLDLYDAAGLVNYLTTQVVQETGQAPDRTSRANGIDTIVKYQIRVHNNMTSSDVNVQAEFSKFVRFEDGAAVPEDVELFERSGDLVGVLSYHPPHGDVRFPMEQTYYWFSLSGPCPNMKNGEKESPNCTKYQPGLVPAKKSQYIAGGLCKQRIFSSEIPDGTPGCSYYIENYTTMKLDDIVGITHEDCGGHKCSNWADFRLHCSNPNLTFTHLGVKYCKEYDFPGCITSCEDESCGTPGAEVGIPFWTGRCNASRNAVKTASLQKSFGGSVNPMYYASNPRCDQYPACSNPAPDSGVSYCHRDDSGVCDPCHIPGTVRAVSPPSQVACRVDLFLNKDLPQYKDHHPMCDTECGGECSTDTASSACCVYLGKCKRVWKAEDWGSCNATCGNGTRFRRVWCPFEEIFGPCEESSKPSNATKCRGDACPWSKDHFGNWSHCDNACGNGTEVQSLICQCPDDCPGKEKECAQSPKPQQPSRPCFPMSSSGEAFCHSCEAQSAQSQCTACTKGFDLKDGKCHGSQRLALVKYELRAFNLSLNNDDWLSSAFVPAFKEVIQEALQSNGSINVSLDVLNLSISKSMKSTKSTTIRKLRELDRSLSSWALVEVKMTAVAADDDKSLEMLLQELNNSKLNVSATAFPKVLVKHGCTTARHCQVPENVTIQLKEASAQCPEGKSWKNSECALPPIPPGPTGEFPMWIVVVIVVVLLLIAAVVTWSCVCKRRTDTSRLLGA